MADIIKFPPRDSSGNGTGSVSVWLRELADQVDQGNFGDIAAAAVVMREGAEGETFRLRTRRCNMSWLEVIGVLKTALHDYLHGG